MFRDRSIKPRRALSLLSMPLLVATDIKGIGGEYLAAVYLTAASSAAKETMFQP